MALSSPLLYRDELETISDDESTVVDDLNRSFDQILKTTHSDYGHAVRAVHAKAHAIMHGTFEVLPNLPSELAQGLFAHPGEHPAWVRISTNPGDILDDAVSLPRGLALKIGEVKGERLPGAEGHAQDFVLVDGPAFAAPDAKKFAGNLKLLASTTDRAEAGKIALSKTLQLVNSALTAVGVESSLVKTLGGAPQFDPLGETYFSAVPFRYGAYIAKFRLRPISADVTALIDREIETKGDPNALRNTIRDEMSRIDGQWAFEVQLARDLERQPVEDASVVWDEETAPFQQVAVLRLPSQDSFDPGLVEQVNETMRFSPWTGLSAHRPLGNVNRARREAYRHSSEFRATANRCPIHEP